MLSEECKLNGPLMTTKLAYLTMFEFLKRYGNMNDSRDIRRLLRQMALLKGHSLDPDVLNDWSSSMEAVLRAEGTSEGYRDADSDL